jgi:hypothetical protein
VNQALQPGYTVQNRRIIELTNSARPMFYSDKLGRDWGSPSGGWVEEREKATVMEEYKAQDLLYTALVHVAPFCRVVAP